MNLLNADYDAGYRDATEGLTPAHFSNYDGDYYQYCLGYVEALVTKDYNEKYKE